MYATVASEVNQLRSFLYYSFPNDKVVQHVMCSYTAFFLLFPLAYLKDLYNVLPDVLKLLDMFTSKCLG